MADSFNDVLSRLQGSFQNLSQFSADLAHDMRTPLNNLMVQTQVALSQTRERDEYEELLTSHHEEYERLVRMVETMLFLARADHDEIVLTAPELDVSLELHRIAEYFEGPASDAGVRFAVAGTGAVVADAVLFRRAVGNLVSNALRYTPRGSVINLDGEQSEKGMTITVSNPGIGIDGRDLPRLFERFYRSDKSRSSSGTSAGLGLAIVKSIMKLHGGTAAVHSTNDRATFTLFFPSTNTACANILRP
jgi:two-component system heavy metal sensor histidine kinase CusS